MLITIVSSSSVINNHQEYFSPSECLLVTTAATSAATTDHVQCLWCTVFREVSQCFKIFANQTTCHL